MACWVVGNKPLRCCSVTLSDAAGEAFAALSEAPVVDALIATTAAVSITDFTYRSGYLIRCCARLHRAYAHNYWAHPNSKHVTHTIRRPFVTSTVLGSAALKV